MKDKTFFLFFFALTAALILFALLFLYLIYVFRNRKNSEYFEQQFHMRDRLQAQVEEYKRLCYQVSRDIHNQIVQNALLMRHLLSNFKDYGCGNEKSTEALSEILDLNDQQFADANHLCFSLNAEYIASHDLEELITDELKHICGRDGMQFEVDCELKSSLSPDDRTIVYRIVQEALGNISRHSMATYVKVEVQEIGNIFRIVIHDNGMGISKDRIYSTHVSGINNMRQRAAMLNGTLEIQSRKEGSSVIFSMEMAT